MMTRTTIDTEHGDGPNVTTTYESGNSEAIVFDESDECMPVKAYKNGELVWHGDVQDVIHNLREGDWGLQIERDGA